MHLIETVRCAQLFSIEPKRNGTCSTKLRYLRLYTMGRGFLFQNYTFNKNNLFPHKNTNHLETQREYFPFIIIQGGSNMTGTDLYVNKPHCAAAVRP